MVLGNLSFVNIQLRVNDTWWKLPQLIIVQFLKQPPNHKQNSMSKTQLGRTDNQEKEMDKEKHLIIPQDTLGYKCFVDPSSKGLNNVYFKCG